MARPYARAPSRYAPNAATQMTGSWSKHADQSPASADRGRLTPIFTLRRWVEAERSAGVTTQRRTRRTAVRRAGGRSSCNALSQTAAATAAKLRMRTMRSMPLPSRRVDCWSTAMGCLLRACRPCDRSQMSSCSASCYTLAGVLGAVGRPSSCRQAGWRSLITCWCCRLLSGWSRSAACCGRSCAASPLTSRPSWPLCSSSPVRGLPAKSRTGVLNS